MDKEYDEMTEEEYESRIVKTESMYDFFKEEAYMLCDENKKLKKKYNLMKENANQLVRKIDKAIEHLEESIDIIKGDSMIPISSGNVRRRYLQPVLDILKGEDK